MNDLPIYLDYNSTTPVDPRVLEAMLPYFTEKFGNPASRSHRFGWVAEEAVKIAREKVAELINASPEEIYFTSGSTEGLNAAIKGIFEAYSEKGNHIITTSIEHKAVLDTCEYLEEKGAQVTYVPSGKDGIIDLEVLKNAITDKTILICVIYANNETGMIQPIAEIGKIAKEKEVIFLTDATQAVGKKTVDVQFDNIDILTISAHKFYGPKGSGALFLRRKNPRVTIVPLIHGGGHEKNIRSGTLNVPGIVGLGKAAEIALEELWDDAKNTSALRTKLEQELVELGNVFVNGNQKNRLPNTTNLAFLGMKSDEFIKKLKNVAISTGSACTSAIPEPSHVLMAMGISSEMAYSSVRFSLGRFTKPAEISTIIEKAKDILKERNA